MRNLFRALYWGFKGFRVKGLAMWGVLGIEALVLCGFLLIYAGKRTNRAIDPGGALRIRIGSRSRVSETSVLPLPICPSQDATLKP